MAKLIRVMVLTFMLAVPLDVEAECAWVLWYEASGTTQPWQAVGAWPDQQKCENERIAWYGRLGHPVPPIGGSTKIYSTTGASMGSMRYVCLPDTIDPRGPKGGWR